MMLRRVISKLPGARAAWSWLTRLRTPPRVRWQLDMLQASVARLDADLADLTEFALGGVESVPESDGSTALWHGPQVTGEPRRALCSIGTGPYHRMLDICAETYRGYANLHGYALHLCTEWLVPERPVPWSKIELVRRLLSKYDEVLWIDSDAIFVDIVSDIAENVSPDKDLYLVEHVWDEGRRQAPNTGVFLIRSSPWSRQLLDDIWNAKRFIHHRYWENAALCDLLGYEYPADHSRPRKISSSPLEDRISFLSVEWNSLTGIDPHATSTRSDHPRIRHHGRPSSVAELRQRLLADLVTYRKHALKLGDDRAT